MKPPLPNHLVTVNPRKLLAASLLALLSVTALATQDEEAKFLPFMGPRLEAARYAPADEEFAWVGWIGAAVDLVEKGKWSGYFNADVETILGHRTRSFEAVQANYVLEIGARRDMGRARLSPFFHHVSRHVQDRDKTQAVDWNFLGARFDSPWPEKWNRRGEYQASLGVATLSSGLDYNWEARLAGEVDVVRRSQRAMFALADLRLVGASPTPGFPRDHVADFRAEIGFRKWQEQSVFDLFVAYEHRGDALITRSLVTNRALLGFRIRGHRRSGPVIVPRP